MNVTIPRHDTKGAEIIKKTDGVLEKYGLPSLADDDEKMLAVATSLKLKRDSYSSLIKSVVVVIPLIVAWVAKGGGFTLEYWGLFGAILLVSRDFTFFQDKSSHEAAAAVLERRIN
ncbi:hypothetical protein [Actinomyces oris]|uniref:hypothetical protein n=1 Tax=Actinomyces oris TaxID=544580 RepID=UPI00242FF61C|nr:hypothetical protein [Actinomyces oris]